MTLGCFLLYYAAFVLLIVGLFYALLTPKTEKPE